MKGKILVLQLLFVDLIKFSQIMEYYENLGIHIPKKACKNKRSGKNCWVFFSWIRFDLANWYKNCNNTSFNCIYTSRTTRGVWPWGFFKEKDPKFQSA